MLHVTTNAWHWQRAAGLQALHCLRGNAFGFYFVWVQIRSSSMWKFRAVQWSCRFCIAFEGMLSSTKFSFIFCYLAFRNFQKEERKSSHTHFGIIPIVLLYLFIFIVYVIMTCVLIILLAHKNFAQIESLQRYRTPTY